MLYLNIISCFFDFRVPVKHDRELVLNACISLVCHLNASILEHVNLVLAQNTIIFICLFVKEGCLNLRTFTINKLYVQKSSMSFVILPRL